MTNPNRRLYVGIIDTSGSMEPLLAETLAGWNSLVKEQAALGGAFFSLFTFNSTVRKHYEFVEYDEVPALDAVAFGYTALHDGLGTGIDSTGRLLAGIPVEERPSLVAIATYTDGRENDSHRYTQSQVRGKVEHQQEKYGWKFLFHGAGQDAVLIGQGLGIPRETSVTYNVANTTNTFNTTSGLLSRGVATGSYAYTDAERAEVNQT